MKSESPPIPIVWLTSGRITCAPGRLLVHKHKSFGVSSIAPVSQILHLFLSQASGLPKASGSRRSALWDLTMRPKSPRPRQLLPSLSPRQQGTVLDPMKLQTRTWLRAGAPAGVLLPPSPLHPQTLLLHPIQVESGLIQVQSATDLLQQLEYLGGKNMPGSSCKTNVPAQDA